MNVLSLFSGCGGMDIGFEGGFTCLAKSINEKIHPDWVLKRNGAFITVSPTIFTTIFANDIRPDAKATWVNYFSKYKENANEIYHLDSIVDLVKRFRMGTYTFPDNVDIVIGGFPCQSFSIAGKRYGFQDTKDHFGKYIETPTNENRGMLYMWMRDVISITKPKIFIAENVKGLTNLGDAKTIIEHDFATACENGYIVVPAKVLYTADYGVPQARERVIFFGFKKDALTKEAIEALSMDIVPPEYDPYPVKTHGDGLSPFVTCRDAFVGLEEPEDSSDPSQQKYSKAKYMGKHCQGQTEVKLDDVGPTIRSEHHGNIEYRRLNKEHGGHHQEELSDGLLERRLSVRECARIQTFPDDYQFILPRTKENVSVSASNAYKIIGNAVPPILAYHIAQNLASKWALYFGD